MPTGFQTGARPAKTYILPPAATPDISSAGWGNGASFIHFSWAWAKVVAKARPITNVNRCGPAELHNLNIVSPLQEAAGLRSGSHPSRQPQLAQFDGAADRSISRCTLRQP